MSTPAAALLIVSSLLSAAAAAADDPLPEGNAYVRGLADRQRQRAEVLDTYTYDTLAVQEDLDGKGKVTRRRTRAYETFFVGGRPVRRQVAEDNRPLDEKQQARADRDVEDKTEAIRKGQAAEEKPGARLLVILERFDFRTAGREDIDGRPAIVLDFTPQPGKRDIEGDAALRHLTGRIWVDEAEREIVRAEIRNREPIKLAWGWGPRYPVSRSARTSARSTARRGFRSGTRRWPRAASCSSRVSGHASPGPTATTASSRSTCRRPSRRPDPRPSAPRRRAASRRPADVRALTGGRRCL